ncbi:hypothetical protein MASR2M70_04950 [Bacillota bacterium]
MLPIGGVPAVKHIFEAFREAGIENIVVVTGYNRELIAPVLEEENITEAFNENFSAGMFESIKTGIRAGIEVNRSKLRPAAPLSAFILAPADTPLVPAGLIDRIIQEHMENPKAFIVPCFRGKKGHPLLIPAMYSDEIMLYEGDRGLKGVTSLHDDNMIRLESRCEAVVLDMDTPEGYEEILQYYEKNRAHPQEWESAEELMEALAGRRLFLVRHGEIQQHKEKIFLGQYDVPLSEKGREQAAAAGYELAAYNNRSERIYSSDLMRAVESSHIIAKTLYSGGQRAEKPEIIKEAGLREMSLGSWDGRFISEIKALYPDMYEKRGKDILSFKFDNDSENFYDLRYRAVKSIKKILSEDCSEDIVIVAHSGIIKVLQSAIWGTDLREELKKPIANGGVSLIQPSVKSGPAT